MKNICIRVLILFIFIVCSVFALYGQSSSPIDLIVVLDTSSSMASSYEDVNDYITGDLLSEYLRNGDTFHLIVYSGEPRLDVARRINGIGDIETIIGRMLIQYPIEQAGSDGLRTALNFTEEYASALPSRPKKIVVIGIGGSNADSIVSSSRQRLSSFDTTLDFVNVTPGQQLTNLPRSGRPASPARTAAAVATGTAAGTAASGTASGTAGVSTGAAGGSIAASNGSEAGTTASGTTSSAAGTSGSTASTAGSTAGTSASSTADSAAGTAGSTAGTTTLGVTSGGSESGTTASVTADSTAGTSATGITDSAAGASASGMTDSETSAASDAAGTASSGITDNAAAAAGDTYTVDSTANDQGDIRGVSAVQTEQPSSRERRDGTSSGIASSLPWIIIIVIAALLLLGLLIFLLSRRLSSRPNRVIAKASSARPAPAAEKKDDLPRPKDHSKDLANYAAIQNRQRTTPYADRPKKNETVKPAVINPAGPLLLNLFVEDQNTAIGKRNIHSLKSGYKFSVGGGKSDDFYIFLVPIPGNIAEIRRDGTQLTFTPKKPKYFPDIGSNEVRDCINKTIRIISDKNYEIRFRFEMYEDPLISLNRMLNSVNVPG